MCPSVEVWENKVCYIHIKECCVPVKNEQALYALIWKSLQGVLKKQQYGQFLSTSIPKRWLLLLILQGERSQCSW